MEHQYDCPRLQFWDAGEHQAPCTCDDDHNAGEPLVTFDLSGLVPAERDVIGYGLAVGEIGFSRSGASVLGPPGRINGTLDRLSIATKRRPAVLLARKNDAGITFYRVDPEALDKYLASKKPKKGAQG